MSFRDERTERWEARLKAVFDEIDAHLERKYGDRYPLHPARAPQSSTGNPEDDGLFDVGAAFSAGYGSEHGPGYIVQVRLATLRHVPADVQRAIEAEVIDQLAKNLPRAFPGKDLRVEQDGPVFKITGDLGIPAN